MTSARVPGRVAVPAVVLMIAAVVRLWGLSSPPSLYWDEQYYVFDAEAYLGGGIGQPIEPTPAVKIADEGTWVHPPGGKWIIALLGVGPLGNRPIGWRLPSAAFGIAGVALLYLLALELWGSVWWAGFCALLLALDGLHIVQSRMAMLDIFLTTFITAGTLFVVLDRRRMREPDGRRSPPPWVTRVFGSWYRLGAGAAFGAAVAIKWSGAFALVFGAALGAVWALRGEAASGRPRWATAGSVLVSFALVPLLVYLISYGSFFYQHGLAIHDFLTLQLKMLQYQQGHLKVQPENSLPWTWPLLLHPIQYFKVMSGSSSSRIVAMGNPVLWWGFLALLPIAVVQIVRRPTWQAAVAFGGYAAMFLPWFVIGRSRYLYYLLPAVPYMCLGVTSAIRGLPARSRQAVAIGFSVLTVSTAVIFLPAWTGWLVPTGWMDGIRFLSTWPL